MSLALKLALSPLLVVQGLLTRRRMPRLPEAQGQRQGECGTGGAALRLLIVGDSSAAGVGVDHQDQALAGQMSRALAALTGACVRWQLLAQSGLNTAQLLALLQAKRPDAADVAVVVSGVNDVVEQIASHRAVAAREQLAAWLLAQGLARHVVFAPVPPMGLFKGLPQPLRWVAGRDARRHDHALARWAAQREKVSHVVVDLPFNAGMLASDGFHPGAPVYRVCGHALAEHVALQLWPRMQGQSG